MAKKSKAEKTEEIKTTKTSAKDDSSKKDSKKKSDSKKDASSKKSNNKNAKSGNKVSRYFRDLKSEFKKVVWPSKKQVFNNTLVVLVTIFIFMVIVGGFDTIMYKALQLLVSNG